MNRDDLIPYVAWIVDDAQGVIQPNDDALPPHIREVQENDTLVVYQCGFEPLVIAARDTVTGNRVPADDAEEMAAEWLIEIDWFGGEPYNADYIL